MSLCKSPIFFDELEEIMKHLTKRLGKRITKRMEEQNHLEECFFLIRFLLVALMLTTLHHSFSEMLLDSINAKIFGLAIKIWEYSTVTQVWLWESSHRYICKNRRYMLYWQGTDKDRFAVMYVSSSKMIYELAQYNSISAIIKLRYIIISSRLCYTVINILLLYHLDLVNILTRICYTIVKTLLLIPLLSSSLCYTLLWKKITVIVFF